MDRLLVFNKKMFCQTARRLRFSSDADIVRLTNARIIIINLLCLRPHRAEALSDSYF